MIIWRGWGILALPVLGIGVVLIGSIGSKPGHTNYLTMGLGLVVSGILTFLMGYWLNVLRPRQQVEARVVELRQQFWHRVRTGNFQVAPGAPAPRSQEEASAQVEHLLGAERQSLLRASSFSHSLFFIPVHWLGVAAGVLGIGMFIAGLVQQLG